jgi:hypothetical protein
MQRPRAIAYVYSGPAWQANGRHVQSNAEKVKKIKHRNDAGRSKCIEEMDETESKIDATIHLH